MSPLFLDLNFVVSGFILTAIGALPLGIVNLSVAETASKLGMKSARKISIGASFVEVVYSLIAIYTSMGILVIHANNPLLNLSAIIVLSIISIYFFFKKSKEQKNVKKTYNKGIIKGILLNAISIQVLLFWLFIVLYGSTLNIIPILKIEIIFFIVGVIISKLLILEIYGRVGSKLMKKSTFIEKNINRIIGFLIFSAALFQFTKF